MLTYAHMVSREGNVNATCRVGESASLNADSHLSVGADFHTCVCACVCTNICVCMFVSLGMENAPGLAAEPDDEQVNGQVGEWGGLVCK